MRQTVLVADDSEFVRETVGATLRAHGELCVLQARNGREALDILAHDETVGAVVLDVAMRIVGAPEVLHRLAQVPQQDASDDRTPWHKPFIVAVGGAGELEALEKCRSLGADAVMMKPLELGTLRALVRRGLAKAREI